MFTSAFAHAQAPKCADGKVWREAGPKDFVCVTPQSRALVRKENALAQERRLNPASKTNYNCKQGYVWREAFESDYVCVSPARRTEVQQQNKSMRSISLREFAPSVTIPNTPAPVVVVPTDPNSTLIEIDPSLLQAVELPEYIMLCNQMQIHLARADYWRALYRGYGVSEDAIENHHADLSSATSSICADQTRTAGFSQVLARIEAFRDDVDERNSELWSVPREDATRQRLRGFLGIDTYIEQSCLTQQERMHMPMQQFPQTPQFSPTPRPVVPAATAAGNCPTGTGGESAGGGGTGPGPIDAGAYTLQGQARRVEAFTSCLSDFATQARQCESPVAEGDDDGPNQPSEEPGSDEDADGDDLDPDEGERSVTEEEARRALRRANQECRAAGNSCTRQTDARHGKIIFKFRSEQGGGDVLETITFSIPGGGITSILRTTTMEYMGRVWSIPDIVTDVVRGQSAAPHSRILVPIILFEDEPEHSPGGTQYCESFSASGVEDLTYLDRSAQVSNGQRLPPMRPRNIMQFCRCQAGRSVGDDSECQASNDDHETRIFCMRAGGVVADSDRCQRAFREDLGPGVDVSAICSSVIQCPPNSVMQGTPIAGNLVCGCGRSGRAGSGGFDECRNVSCPGPGATFDASQSQCCRPAIGLSETPRQTSLSQLRNLRLELFDPAITEQLIEASTRRRELNTKLLQNAVPVTIEPAAQAKNRE